MTILYHIAATWNAAGMERVLAEKVNWLVSRGYKVIVVTCDQRGLPHAFRMDFLKSYCQRGSIKG